MKENPNLPGILEKAAQAARVGSLEKAVTLAEEAVGLSAEDSQGAAARLELARLLAVVGDFERAEALVNGVMDFAGECDDGPLRSRAFAVSGLVAFGRGRSLEAVDFLRNALFEAEEDTAPDMKAGILEELARALLESGDRDGARAEADRALREASRAANPDLAASARATALRCGVKGLEDDLASYLEGEAVPAPTAWHVRFALAEARLERGEDAEAEKEFAGALRGLKSVWEDLTPRRRSSFLSTAPLKRFCLRLVSRPGEPAPFENEGSVVREIRREVLEEAGGVELDGIKEVIRAVGDSQLASRLETFRAQYGNLMRLQEVIKAVNSELHLDPLLSTIMDHAVDIAGAERGFLMLAEEGTLRFRVARNIDQEKVRKPEFKISHSIAEETFRNGKAILTANAKEDPRFAGSGSVHGLKLTSVLCLPLRIRDRVTGVLYLDNRFRAGQFSPDVLRLLDVFCDQASIALENARLLEENAKAKEDLLALNRKLSDLNQHLKDRVREQEEALGRAHMAGPLPSEARQYGMLLSRSPRMEELFKLLDKVVESDVPVLIQGESGTGKELVARVIHEKSARSARSFVSENCGALSETLLESELFGHVRGAFTGAFNDRAGLFELADGGTLFLDEVGEMSPEMQKKLLRALQEGEVRPVGAKEARKVDARVLSASNRNLRELVREGAFREDLFFRLNVLQIDLLPLRERPEDIPLLLDHFLGTGEKPEFTERALRRVMHYRWPGNVRELRNLAERLKALKVSRVSEAELPKEMWPERDPAPGPPDLTGTLVEMEEGFVRSVILRALSEARNNKTRAAELLGIPKTTLYNRMKRCGIADE